MSARQALVLVVSLFTLTFLIACGSSGNNITQGQNQGFNTGSLNGTYVFSVSGTDFEGAPYTILGTFTANGNGGINGGTIDMNDVQLSSADETPLIDYSINTNSTYIMTSDGRGQAKLGLQQNPVQNLSGCQNNGNITLDFVLQNTSHGLVTEFDCNATGSGTLDLQSAGITPAGSYAFSLSGGTGDEAFATVGNFTLTGSTISSGLEDFNTGGVASTNDNDGWPLSGTVVAGPTSTPGTTLSTGSGFGTITFDVYPIDSTHLKFIEVDSLGTLSGDAYSESATVSTGTLPFTLEGGLLSGEPIAVGGYMVTNGSGTITNSSSEDYNAGGSTISTVPASFSGTYTAAGSARYLIDLSGGGFFGGTEYVAYPSSGGTLMMEIDNAGIEVGAAYGPQSTTSAALSGGYGLNLSGVNLAEEEEIEVDDIAEFTAAASGTSCSANGTQISSDTLTGASDENYTGAEQSQFYGQALCGDYAGPDSTGRFALTYATSSLDGAPALTAYTLDGTTFPFIEQDANGQVSSGVFVAQSATASAGIAKSHSLFVPHPLPRPNAKRKQAQKKQ